MLGKELELPYQILLQPSSPGFWRGHLAEKEIGLPYNEIDRILDSYQRNQLGKRNFSQKKLKLVIDLIKKNQHKKGNVPTCKSF